MYEFKTTFWMDFSIADRFGAKAIKDTFKRAMKEWKDDVDYMGELTVVLNHKIWQHYEKRPMLGELYNTLWEQCQSFCWDHFKGEDATRYYQITD